MDTSLFQNAISNLVSSDLRSADFSARTVATPELPVTGIRDRVIAFGKELGPDWEVVSIVAHSIDTACSWIEGAQQTIAQERMKLLTYAVCGADHSVRQTQRVLRERGEGLELNTTGKDLIEQLVESGKLLSKSISSLSEGMRNSASEGADPFADFRRDLGELQEHRKKLLHALGG